MSKYKNIGDEFELNNSLHRVIKVDKDTKCRECALYTARCLEIFRNCHKVSGIVVKVHENKD